MNNLSYWNPLQKSGSILLLGHPQTPLASLNWPQNHDCVRRLKLGGHCNASIIIVRIYFVQPDNGGYHAGYKAQSLLCVSKLCHPHKWWRCRVPPPSPQHLFHLPFSIIVSCLTHIIYLKNRQKASNYLFGMLFEISIDRPHQCLWKFFAITFLLKLFVFLFIG